VLAGAKIAAVGSAALVIPIVLITAVGGVLVGMVGDGSAGCTPSHAPSAEVPGYDAEQIANAATIVAVGEQLQVPERGWIVAVATAMQESRLRNLDHGDRDSLGLFQQRPSQGWGRPDQVQDPAYAATQFYRHLRTVPNWETLDVNAAAQAVQRSGTPYAYARHVQAAREIVSALHGTSCAIPAETPAGIRTDWPSERATEADPTSDGRITPRTFALVRALQANAMTGAGLGCYGRRPANPRSDHPQGRACDIMLEPGNRQSVAEGWRITNWLIAHQARLGVRYLIWQGQYWSADNPTWTPYTSSAYGCPNPTNLTGCHYDHIHISMY
jgi:hypothetical protein